MNTLSLLLTATVNALLFAAAGLEETMSSVVSPTVIQVQVARNYLLKYSNQLSNDCIVPLQ